MVSIITISYGEREPTHGYQNCYNSRILGGDFKVGEFLYT